MNPSDIGMSFTKKEKAVIMALFDGLSNREIAGRLGISEERVKHHLRIIGYRLGIDRSVFCLRVRICWLLRGEFCDIAA